MMNTILPIPPVEIPTIEWMGKTRTVEYVKLSQVADYYRRYPGEEVILFIRIDTLENLSQLTLSVDLPAGITLSTFLAPEQFESTIPTVMEIGDGLNLAWKVDQAIQKDSRLEFEVHAEVRQDAAAGDVDNLLSCTTEVSLATQNDDTSSVSTTTAIAVGPKGRYLKYLPGIYREDELMGRFLMLFESFWSPIESQIGDIHYYLNPLLAPAALLPWLASWADLVLDERWSEEKRRRLVKSIVSLFRRRGTRSGLEEMLEIYTGVRPQILEHRANNLVLGDSARLGPSIALGSANIPHTFTLSLRLPPVDAGSQGTLSGDEIANRKAERRRVIEKIIESEKPAHTRYELEIDEA